MTDETTAGVVAPIFERLEFAARVGDVGGLREVIRQAHKLKVFPKVVADAAFWPKVSEVFANAYLDDDEAVLMALETMGPSKGARKRDPTKGVRV